VSESGSSSNAAVVRSKSARVGLIATMIGSLVAASFVREQTVKRTTQTRAPGAATGAQASLASLDSFAMGLLLGGFRGPLVMAMWMNIEGQKARRDYEDIDTRINLVRLLQPEFDDVHLYQIGNKAYNLSVQLTSLAAKYSAVLEGLDYAAAVERERPLNINILARTADIYFQKLGESTEKVYYRARIRDDTLAPEPVVQFTVSVTQKDQFEQSALQAGLDPSSYTIQQNLDPTRISFLMRNRFAQGLRDSVATLSPQVVERPARTIDIRDPGFRRFAHDPVLDENGNVLAEWITPVNGPTAMTGDSPDTTLDGSRLQFIKQFEPFPQGVSTYAFAYNAFKKADALRRVRGLRAAEFPPRVLSSRAAIALKFWAEEEFNLGRRFEAAAAGNAQALDREFPEMEMVTAEVGVFQTFNARLAADALHNYDRVLQLIAASRREYEAHIARFSQDRQLYRVHLEWLAALEVMIRADQLFLRASQSPPDEHKALLEQSRDMYAKARVIMLRYGLTYFVNDELAQKTFPPNFSRQDAADRLPDDLLGPTYFSVMAFVNRPENSAELANLFPRELAEFATYAQRCEKRIERLNGLLAPP
jgi:hypothetical protein